MRRRGRRNCSVSTQRMRFLRDRTEIRYLIEDDGNAATASRCATLSNPLVPVNPFVGQVQCIPPFGFRFTSSELPILAVNSQLRVGVMLCCDCPTHEDEK